MAAERMRRMDIGGAGGAPVLRLRLATTTPARGEGGVGAQTQVRRVGVHLRYVGRRVAATLPNQVERHADRMRESVRRGRYSGAATYCPLDLVLPARPGPACSTWSCLLDMVLPSQAGFITFLRHLNVDTDVRNCVLDRPSVRRSFARHVAIALPHDHTLRLLSHARARSHLKGSDLRPGNETPKKLLPKSSCSRGAALANRRTCR